MEDSHKTADYPDRLMGEDGSRAVTSVRARLLPGNRRLRASAREMIVFKAEPEPCGAFNSPLIRWQLEGIPQEQIGKATSQHVHLNLNRFNVCLEQLLNRSFFFLSLLVLVGQTHDTAQICLELVKKI